jgi:UDP-N-acetylglucosamine transferase subunit ALG13
MIFVTVGTHEQQFNRLIKEVDRLKGNGNIQEDVFIQTGYSDYEPKHCAWSPFVKFDEMREYINRARIVVTHGGPASFLSVLEQHKSPIVVPRRVELDEHVNNHQLDFSIKIQNLGYKIYVVEDIVDLAQIILSYETSDEEFTSNNQRFNQELGKLVKSLRE